MPIQRFALAGIGVKRATASCYSIRYQQIFCNSNFLVVSGAQSVSLFSPIMIAKTEFRGYTTTLSPWTSANHTVCRLARLNKIHFDKRLGASFLDSASERYGPTPIQHWQTGYIHIPAILPLYLARNTLLTSKNLRHEPCCYTTLCKEGNCARDRCLFCSPPTTSCSIEK
jgi:hypothetical protein